LSFTFENLNVDSWLVVSICGEDLGLLGWDGSISFDQLGHDTSGGLDTHREWGDIEQ